MNLINDEYNINFNQTKRIIRYLIDITNIEEISTSLIIDTVLQTSIEDNTLFCFYTEIYDFDYFESEGRVCIYVNFANGIHDVTISALESTHLNYFEHLENLKIEIIMGLVHV